MSKHPYDPDCLCGKCSRRRDLYRTRDERRALVRAELKTERETFLGQLRAAMAAIESPDAITWKHGEPVLRPVPPPVFWCPGCRFGFSSAPTVKTACQYCGTELLPPCTCEHTAWKPGTHGPVCPQYKPEEMRCWCSWCKGGPLSGHGAEATALYRQETAAVFTKPQRGLPHSFREDPDPQAALEAELDAGTCKRCGLGTPIPDRATRLCTYCYDLAGLEAVTVTQSIVPGKPRAIRYAHPQLAAPRPARQNLVTRSLVLTAVLAVLAAWVLIWIVTGAGLS